MALEPRRVVVELTPSQYEAIERLGRGRYRSLSAAQVIRCVAVRLTEL
jgi:hypothetical protein